MNRATQEKAEPSNGVGTGADVSEPARRPPAEIRRRELLRRSAAVGAIGFAAPNVVSSAVAPALAQAGSCIPEIGLWTPTPCAFGISPIVTADITVESPSIELTATGTNFLFDLLCQALNQTFVSPTASTFPVSFVLPSSACPGEPPALSTSLDISAICGLWAPIAGAIETAVAQIIADNLGGTLNSAVLSATLNANIGGATGSGTITAEVGGPCTATPLALMVDPFFVIDPPVLDAAGECEIVACPGQECPTCAPMPAPVTVTWTPDALDATLELVGSIEVALTVPNPIPFLPDITGGCTANLVLSTGSVTVDLDPFETCCEYACQ